MIINLLLNVVVLVFGAILSLLPTIQKLPSIMGYDIDASLVAGMGYINSVVVPFWVIGYIVNGALVILGYHLIKFIVIFFFGHRTPR